MINTNCGILSIILLSVHLYVLTGDYIICNSCIIPFFLYSLPFILFREC